MSYTTWKFVHHWDKIEQLKEGKQINPISLKIILTNTCTRKCHFCFEKEKNKMFQETLNTDVALKLIEDAKEIGIKSIEFTGGGEPTDHPEFKKIFMRAKDLGFDLGLVTNGSNLSKMDISILDNITWLRISINALSDNVYLKTCGVPFNYKNILPDIGKLNTTVGASFVITSRNYLEIVDFAKYMKEIGFKNVRFTPAREDFNIANDTKEIWDKCIPLLNEAKKLEDDSFRVYAMSDRISSLDTTKKYFENCYFQQMVVNVWSNGELIPCCEVRGYEGAKYGNLYESSLSEIWKNKQLFGVEKCQIACLYEDKNRFIEYLVEKKPKHINFI